MASFTTRVELHKATESDYEILHAAMAKEGFTRTIKIDDKEYKLPTAEYNFVGTFTTSQIFDKAVSAANSTKKDNWILVTESNGRTFKLELIKKS